MLRLDCSVQVGPCSVQCRRSRSMSGWIRKATWLSKIGEAMNARMEAGISWKKCLEASINDIYYMCFLYMSMHIHMDMCMCICICICIGIGISML